MFIFFYITLCLLLVYGMLIRYYEQAWKSIPGVSAFTSTKPASVKVTVIVPARNEEVNISRCLESLAAQDYPDGLLEIIVVNDHSTDRTAEVVFLFPAGNIRLINLRDHVRSPINSYKKKAIEVAVAAATGELIVTTDADCSMPPGWISSLAACYRYNDAAFIAAPVKIEATGSLLSIFQAVDFMTLQGITGAAVYKRFHSMCNGANLAYSKKVFYEVGGFQGIDDIASGDDMLLMHKIFVKHPDKVFFLKSKAAVVSTQPALSWKAFIHQRIRWASKADKYEDKRIFFVLVLVYILNLCCLSFLIAGLWNTSWFFLFLIIILVKTLLEYSFVNEVAAFFSQRPLIVYFPFLQPLHVVYTVAAGFMGKFGKYEWKSRKVQ